VIDGTDPIESAELVFCFEKGSAKPLHVWSFDDQLPAGFLLDGLPHLKRPNRDG
jgi:hypothetical protein